MPTLHGFRWYPYLGFRYSWWHPRQANDTVASEQAFLYLGLRCSWWHPRQANDAVASERSIFSENHDYIFKIRVAVNMYEPIFLGLDAHGGKKIRTDTHTNTHMDNYRNPRCACSPKLNYKV